MAITNYSTLNTYITDIFDRADDTDFTSHQDTFIQLAESTWYPTIQNYRMETTATLTTASDGSVALPAGYYRFRALYATINGVALNLPMISPGVEQSLYPVSTGESPAYAKIIGTTLYITPAAAQDVTLDYLGTFTGLSGSNATNWVITAYPSLYLFSVMAQAHLWLGEVDKAANFDAKAMSVLDTINSKFGIDYYNNTELVLEGATP